MGDAQPEGCDDGEMGSLVTAEWLSKHLDDPDLVVLDCTVTMAPKEGGGFTSVSGREAYEGGHVPRAGFADLKGAVSDPDSPLDYALPDPETFCAVMGSLGVGDDTRVVLYDRMNSVWAARVWWMLRWAGFDRVALLDGGLKAWTDVGGELSTNPASYPERHLTPRPRPHLIADKEDVFAAIGDDAITLVDTMNPDHYRGEMTLYARPGHIPTAINIPAMGFFDPSGRFLPRDELAKRIELDRDAPVITYCGGGIAASYVAFIMVQSGFTDVSVYTASLQEWAADPDNPLVVDTALP